ncbi:MAG TPA: hypothetical protein VFV78_09620 [Vicinamibacterales bacterium]|nr:hypothetical protein [Vicinamibacterales bacterium]
MAAQVQPRLLVLGIALLLVGVLALGMAARDRADETRAGAPVYDAIPAEHVNPGHLTMIWPVVGGLSLAVGAACIGVGMNRWKRSG